VKTANGKEENKKRRKVKKGNNEKETN